MNTSNILELVLSGIIMGYFANIGWHIIMNKKINILNWKIHIYSICTALCQFCVYYYVNSYIKVLLITVIFALLITLLYKEKFRNSILIAMVFQIIVFISELLFSLLIFLLFEGKTSEIMNKYFGATITNICVSLISLGFLHFSFFKNLYKKLLEVTNKINFSNLIFVSFILIISVNFFLAVPYYKIGTLTVVIVNTILIFIYSYIILKYIEQKNRYIDISDKYSLSEASLKEVQNNVNRLMALNHENKNQLITIRTMVANKDKDVLKNIDAIVDQKIKDDKELKIRTSVISNTMLGSLIYSKLLTMKENNITHNLHISKAINKSHLINIGDKTNVDICKIVGVYLDNAIEAVMEVDVKEINIDLYLEDNYFCISIANTFKGKVDLDAITDYGYTTKSNGHGYGLSLVKEVIKDNNALSSKTDIIDNKVFVQNLKIKM